MSNGIMLNGLGNVDTALQMSRRIDDSINYNNQNAAQFYETNLANSLPTQMPSRAPSISTPVGTGYNLGTEAAADAYASSPDVIADKYLRQQYDLAYPNGRPHEEPPAVVGPQGSTDGNVGAQISAFENSFSYNSSIEELLQALADLASMDSKEPGSGIFQLDAMYKDSNPMRGPSVAPMQTPMANGRALTTINLGNR